MNWLFLGRRNILQINFYSEMRWKNYSIIKFGAELDALKLWWDIIHMNWLK